MFEKYADAWSQTIAMIGNADIGRQPVETRRGKRSRRVLPFEGAGTEPAVRVLDKPSTRTLTVSWCDSCTGHYGYQTWRALTARRAGTCVLSGHPIRVGDAVYSPRASDPPQGNAGAMIIASCVSVARQV